MAQNPQFVIDLDRLTFEVFLSAMAEVIWHPMFANAQILMKYTKLLTVSLQEICRRSSFVTCDCARFKLSAMCKYAFVAQK